uniref:Imm51 family immunity protein n=1 Tax=Nonomuraea sp. CA-252377 TaxID=3240003 RepID=UPI003F49980B
MTGDEIATFGSRHRFVRECQTGRTCPCSRIPESPFVPFSLFLYAVDPPCYVLELDERAVAAAADVFTAQGLTGSAAHWCTVASQAAKATAPDVADQLESGRLEFGSWAGDDHGLWNNYFAVLAHEADLGELRRLGALLHDLYHDRARLSELIHNLDPVLFEVM